MTDEVKTCKDFAGRCCTSCHDEADAGHHPLLEVDDRNVLFAVVCCIKHGSAQEEFSGRAAAHAAYAGVQSGTLR